MNKEEAIRVVDEWLEKFRAESFVSLVTRIDEQPLTEDVTRGDTRYQLELVCAWDSQPGGPVRVMASIDHGGFRAFVPVCREFIKAADGSFVGE